MMSETVGRITGRKRAAIILIGAVSGLIGAVMFAAFARQPVAPIELIIGAAIGGLLGLSASLGEARRNRLEK
jgi:uncharacterized membrane protein YccC